EVRRTQRGSAIDVAAGDRKAVDGRIRRVVGVLENRIVEWKVGRWGRRHVVVRAFTVAPAVIPAAVRCRLVVDFLPRVLSDVGDNERAGSSVSGIVEAVLPGIAQAERPDLRQGGLWVSRWKWVRRRNRVSEGIALGDARDVQSKHLAQQFLRVL